MKKLLYIISILLITMSPVYAASTDSCYDTDCTLVIHGNGVDGTSNKTVTANGNVQIDTAQFQHGSASILFDGTGDYLSIPDSGAWTFLTGDFTIDAAIRFNAVPGSGEKQSIFCHYVDGSNYDWFHFIESGGTTYLKWSTIRGGSATITVTKAVTIATSTDYHIAITRSGNDFRIFLDGTQIGSAVTDVDSITDIAGTVYIGSFSTSTHYFNGWIDEYRVILGEAAWTTSFTPPTVEYTGADTEPRTLLLHGEGTDASTTITDDAIGDASDSNHHLNFLGDSQLDTAQVTFGSASILLDGTGDAITAADSADWFLDDNDFTIDFLIRWNALGTQSLFSQQNPAGYSPIYLLLESGKTKLYASYNEAGWNVNGVVGSHTLVVDTWYHIAIVRNGTDLSVYVDGESDSSTDISTNSFYNSTHDLSIGRHPAGVQYVNGWYDEFRFVNGTAVWTTDFTPPASAYIACSDSARRVICIS